MNINRIKALIGEQKLKLVYITIVIIILISAMVKYKSGEIDYLNSDATWHTLLTIEAYNETPISQHLFLPIVSLGGIEDKGIPWGLTIPDSEGNYYYTSFSPMGFFLPWLFFKAFHLSINEESLYIFNSLLLVLSALLLIKLIAMIYQNNRNKPILCFVGGITYACLPEILHGMGIVYWHQSILQVTLLLQIIAYYQYSVRCNGKYKWLFYALVFLNPYTEWTGYVANVGFAIAEIIINFKNDWKKGLRKAILIGIITIASFGVFSFHYLLRTDRIAYLTALQNRFMARNLTNSVAMTDLFGGYFESFLYAWILLPVLLIWCFWKNKKLELREGILYFVLAFPVLENIVMKQHALAYSYDRMKAAWILVVIICEVANNILDLSKKEKIISIGIIFVTLCLALFNLVSYIKGDKYIWQVDYRENNQKLAEYILEKYPDGLYATYTDIRGYMNLLFGRGIYEGLDVNQAIELTQEKEKSVTVYIEKENEEYEIKSITVYIDGDISSGTIYRVENNRIVTGAEGYCVADFTNPDWTNGISNTSNTLLFYRDDSLLIDLYSHKKIGVADDMMEILNVNYDSDWILVEVSGKASVCAYPEKIIVE